MEKAQTQVYNDDSNGECGRITSKLKQGEERDLATAEFSRDRESENRSIEELFEPRNSISRLSGSEKLPNDIPKEECRSISPDLPHYEENDSQSSSSTDWTYDSKSISRQASYFDDIKSSSRSSTPFELQGQGRPTSVESMREIMFGSTPASNTHSCKGKVDINADNDYEFEIASKLPRRSKDFGLESSRQPPVLRDLMLGRSIQDTSIPKRPISRIKIGSNIENDISETIADDEENSRIAKKGFRWRRSFQQNSPSPLLLSLSDWRRLLLEGDHFDDEMSNWTEENTDTSKSNFKLKKEKSSLEEQGKRKFRRVSFVEDHAEVFDGETNNRNDPNFFENVVLNVYDELPYVIDSKGVIRSKDSSGPRVYYCDDDNETCTEEEEKIDEDAIVHHKIAGTIFFHVAGIVVVKMISGIRYLFGKTNDDGPGPTNAVDTIDISKAAEETNKKKAMLLDPGGDMLESINSSFTSGMTPATAASATAASAPAMTSIVAGQVSVSAAETAVMQSMAVTAVSSVGAALTASTVAGATTAATTIMVVATAGLGLVALSIGVPSFNMPPRCMDNPVDTAGVMKLSFARDSLAVDVFQETAKFEDMGNEVVKVYNAVSQGCFETHQRRMLNCTFEGTELDNENNNIDIYLNSYVQCNIACPSEDPFFGIGDTEMGSRMLEGSLEPQQRVLFDRSKFIEILRLSHYFDGLEMVEAFREDQLDQRTDTSTNPSTTKATDSPSTQPTSEPSNVPSGVPSTAPSMLPSITPSTVPSATPSWLPSATPSTVPSKGPSFSPSAEPSEVPSSLPSLLPSHSPSIQPSSEPSNVPSAVPSTEPSWLPSAMCHCLSFQQAGLCYCQYSNNWIADPSVNKVSGACARGKCCMCQASFLDQDACKDAECKGPTSEPSNVPSGVPSIK